ncbi:MAG: hypothetical protein JWQ28_2761 [Pedobacter sp.]|jgi:hypothetical protein|nr:hypothetical protein [Pedobacter sp.]
MEINLLLRLLVAHLLTDFVFQPTNWVNDKKHRKIASGKLTMHIIVTTLFAYVFSGEYSNWIIPLVIFVSHYIIDIIKVYLKEKFIYFILDQLAHVLVIIILCLAIENKWNIITPWFNELAMNRNFWILAAGYIFVSWPLGIIIGLATQRWRNQIALEQEKNRSEIGKTNVTDNLLTFNLEEVMKEEQGLGLASAGKWIGICERMLILTFVLMQQYTAIGFLMTAKSILRFSEKEANTQLKTEYVLVGTLVSFTSAAMIGVLLRFFL